MFTNHRYRYLKPLLIVPLALLVLSGVLSSSGTAYAAGKAAFTVMAGQHFDEGDILAFAPQTIRVHRGDSITWKFAPVHDVHLADKPIDPSQLAVIANIDGQQLPTLNPAIAFPNSQSGDAAKPGMSSGVLGAPGGPTEYTSVIDLAPGTYTYWCDIHTGMGGQIVVVDDSVTIPSPSDDVAEGQKQFADVISQSSAGYITASENAQSQPIGDTLQISAGFSVGPGTVNRFFPAVGIIQEGQTVNWTVPAGLESHTVNFSLPADGSLPDSLIPVTDSKGNPYAVFGPTLNPSAKSGDTFTGKDIGSGLIPPTQSFSLKFPKAGVYKYFCAIHPGHVGTIVVLPASIPLSPQIAATQAATSTAQ